MQVDDNNDKKMEKYIYNYAQSFQLPSYYIIDSTVYPNLVHEDVDATYALTLVAFGIPSVTDGEKNTADNKKIQIVTYPHDDDSQTSMPAFKKDIDETY